MKIKVISVIIIALALNACVSNPFIQDELSKEEKLFAENLIEIIDSVNTEKVKSLFSKELQESNIEWLDTLIVGMNKEDIIAKKLVYQKITSPSDPYRSTLSYEIEYSNYLLLLEITTEKKENKYMLAGLYCYPMSNTFENLTTFNFTEKSVVHYLMLLFSISTAIFILFTLFICVKTPIQKKWVWILFILFGFVKISFVWSSGAFDYQLFSINLLGFGIMKHHPYSSWILYTSIPVGAIVFLLKRKSIEVQKQITEEYEDSLSSGG